MSSVKVVTVDFDDTLVHDGIYPNQKVVEYLRSLVDTYHLVLVTSRYPKDAGRTKTIIKQTGLNFWKFYFLGRDNMVQAKVNTVKELDKQYGVVVALENNPNVIKAYRAAGINAVDPVTI